MIQYNFDALKLNYNLRITYLDKEILLINDDFKSAFRHTKYHLDVASVFAFIFFTIVNFDWICIWLYNQSSKYWLFRGSKYKIFVKGFKVKYNKGVKSEKDKKLTKFVIFIGDSLFAEIYQSLEIVMMASIEKHYLVFDFFKHRN